MAKPTLHNPARYSPEVLQAAFRGLREHGQGSMDRYATVDDALASPHAALLRMHASLLSRGIDPYHSRREEAKRRAVAHTVAQKAAWCAAYAGRDLKRAAAGDLDDA